MAIRERIQTDIQGRPAAVDRVIGIFMAHPDFQPIQIDRVETDDSHKKVRIFLSVEGDRHAQV